MRFDGLGHYATVIAHIAPTVNTRVTIEDFFPAAAMRQANPVGLMRYRREIQNDDRLIFFIRRLSQKWENTMVPIVAVDPTEARIIIIRLP